MTGPTKEYEALDRRPIRSRSTAWAHGIADLAMKVGLTPNQISILGMLFAIIAGLLLGLTDQVEAGPLQRVMWIIAAVGIQLRLLCNMIDGMVALATGRASQVGELYNDVPDRVADVAVLIGAGYAIGGEPALGYLAAVLAVSTAYVRTLGRSLGAPSDFCGPLAKPQRMFCVTVVLLWVGLTPFSWQFTWGLNDDWGIMAGVLLIMIIGTAITIVRRLAHLSRSLRSDPS